MEPKFQSSFIPKGPLASASTLSKTPVKTKSLLDTIATIIFALAVISSIGVFGYTRYLDYRIDRMGAELEAARGEVESDVTRELIRLDARLASTKTLLGSHVVIGPLLDFLESSTLRSVRFSSFNFRNTPRGIELSMTGQARSYSALASQADVFSKSQHLRNQVFSDLDLDEQGNVIFSFKASIDPSLVAYRRVIERENAQQPALIVPAVIPASPAAASTEEAATSSASTSN